MEKAKIISKQRNIELDYISYVASLQTHIFIRRPISYKQPGIKALLYFHQSFVSRSSPRDYWGFFSASPDPCAKSTGLEDLGWTTQYSIYYETMCVGDDWGRKYQRALRASLAAMPGGYPGAYIEQLSDDEAE